MLSLGMWLRKNEFNFHPLILAVVYIISFVLIMVLQRFSPISAYNYDFILNVVSAVCLFLLFRKLTITSRAINFCAKSCFAIFCLHTRFFSYELWRKYFVTPEHICSGLGIFIL